MYVYTRRYLPLRKLNVEILFSYFWAFTSSFSHVQCNVKLIWKDWLHVQYVVSAACCPTSNLSIFSKLPSQDIQWGRWFTAIYFWAQEIQNGGLLFISSQNNIGKGINGEVETWCDSRVLIKHQNSDIFISQTTKVLAWSVNPLPLTHKLATWKVMWRIDCSLPMKKFHSQWAILWPWKSSGLLEFCSQRWVRWMHEWQMVSDSHCHNAEWHLLQNSLTLAAEAGQEVLLNSRGPELNCMWSRDGEPEEDWRVRGKGLK